MTGQELSTRIGKGQAWVSKVETGKLVPTVADVEAWADAVKASVDVRASLVDQATALHSEAHAWRALHGPGFRRHQEEIRRIEQEATTIRVFQPNVVPGLLQTAAYVRDMLQANRFTGTKNMTEAVAARVERQAVLYDEAKSFHFVITEGALRWRLCLKQTHLAQLDRIANLATLANVRVGIIPWTAHTPTRQTNMFAVFDDRFAVVETMTTELTLREEADIAFYLAAFDTLDSLAQHDDEARAILDRIAHDVRSLSD